MGSELLIRVLGPVEARRDDRWLRPRTPQQRLVLGVLALRAGLVVPADELIGTVWDGDPPRSVHNSVHVLLANLRKVLAATPDVALETCGSGYRLDADPDRVDAQRFRRLTALARKASGGPAAVASFNEALGLWRGPALADAAGTIRAGQIRAGLAGERLAAMEDRFAALLDCGGHRDAVAGLRHLLEEHPLSERIAEMLMLALYRSGRQADGLAVFREMRKRLAGELGVEPGGALQRMHQRMLAHDPALCGRPRASLGTDPPPAAAAQQAASSAGERPEPLSAAGARPARPLIPRQLPAAIRHFAGRCAELEALSRMLQEAAADDGAMVISVISGTAGVGKTTLALHWAHQVADSFPDGQLYVNLHGCDPSAAPVPPADAIRGLLDALGLPAEQIPADLDAQASLYRSVLASRRMLIVLDNARDERQVRPLLPGGPGTVVVVTSRNQLAGLAAADGAGLLTLDVLSEGEAGELLACRVGASRVAAEPQATAELTRACARLPLALSIAAARAAARTGFPLAALAAELRDVRGRLDALDAGDAATSVRAAFSWSYRQLSDLTARMFRLLSIHPGPDITAAAAASLAGVTLPDTRAALAELGRASLLTEHSPGRFAFHDLMRAYAAERARIEDSEAECGAAALRALDHYLHSARAATLLLYPVPDPIAPPRCRPGVTPETFADSTQAWDWFAAEHQVLMSVVSMAAGAGFDAHAWQIPWALTEFLDRRGHWDDWAATQRTALAAARRAGDKPGQARARRDLGYACVRLGAYREARSHLRHAISLFGELADPGGLARTHHALDQLACEQGRTGAALRYAVRALELYRAVGHLTGQARALNDVGWYHAQLGDHQRTLDLCRQAVPLHRRAGDRSGEADTWDSLGYAHYQLGQYQEAIGCYSKALELYGELRMHRSLGETLAWLADAYSAVGNADAASEAQRQALGVLDELDDAVADELRARLGRSGSEVPAVACPLSPAPRASRGNRASPAAAGTL